MNYKQNEKIAQVTERTLVIGVDIAKETHYARAFNYRGQEIRDGKIKVMKFSNNTAGFEGLSTWAHELMDMYDMDYVIIGMEPTGHYWLTLNEYCLRNKLKVVLVNPFHVKRSKELDDNSPTKNDRKDPKTIAKLVIDGRYVEPYTPEGVYADLREIMKAYERVSKGKCTAVIRIWGWLDQYFPEFKDVFADIEGKTAMVTLRAFPLPVEIVRLGDERVLAEWKKTVPRGIGMKRAQALLDAAGGSSGCTEGTDAAKMALDMLIDEYDMYQRQYDRVMGVIQELLGQITYAAKLLKITGMGLVSIAKIIAEIGDISRFDDAKQVIKYAGLNLVESSSGKHKGITRISKRGRARLRAALFSVMLPMVTKNPEFRALHAHYTTRKENPLKKKQSLIALCCKLVRVMFVMIKKDTDYSADKLVRDIRRTKAAAA